MKKNNKKGFTLIELLAVVIILGILSIISIPAVTKHIEKTKKETYVSNAKASIDVIRDYVLDKSITTDTTITLTQLNNLLTKKLQKSPFGKGYKSFSELYITFDANLNASYSICLVDEDGNGVFTTAGSNAVSVAEENINTTDLQIKVEGITDCIK